MKVSSVVYLPGSFEPKHENTVADDKPVSPSSFPNKEFLETNYPRGRAIEVFRSFHFDLIRPKTEIPSFRFPFLLKQVQHRHGNDNFRGNPDAERRGILFD